MSELVNTTSNTSTYTSHPDDVLVWADNSWCFRCEYNECASAKSDDYQVISAYSFEYEYFFEENSIH